MHPDIPAKGRDVVIAEQTTRIADLQSALARLIVIADIVALNDGGTKGERKDLARLSSEARELLYPYPESR